MPIRIRHGSALGLIVMVWQGTVTEEEFDRLATLLVESPEYNLSRLTLIDTSAADHFEGSAYPIRRIAHRAAANIDGRIGQGARTAIVATRDELFGLGRMYQTLREPSPIEFRVFRSSVEAEEWLTLPPGYETELTDIA